MLEREKNGAKFFLELEKGRTTKWMDKFRNQRVKL